MSSYLQQLQNCIHSFHLKWAQYCLNTYQISSSDQFDRWGNKSDVTIYANKQECAPHILLLFHHSLCGKNSLSWRIKSKISLFFPEKVVIWFGTTTPIFVCLVFYENEKLCVHLSESGSPLARTISRYLCEYTCSASFMQRELVDSKVGLVVQPHEPT